MMPIIVPAGCEIMLPFEQDHPKKEYIKILHDRPYSIRYKIVWYANKQTSCPLRVNLYRVTKDFALELFHSHVTVHVNKRVNLDKHFTFDLKKGERICLGARNMSLVEFTIESATLTTS
jgi:hypothetical protein